MYCKSSTPWWNKKGIPPNSLPRGLDGMGWRKGGEGRGSIASTIVKWNFRAIVLCLRSFLEAVYPCTHWTSNFCHRENPEEPAQPCPRGRHAGADEKKSVFHAVPVLYPSGVMPVRPFSCWMCHFHLSVYAVCNDICIKKRIIFFLFCLFNLWWLAVAVEAKKKDQHLLFFRLPPSKAVIAVWNYFFMSLPGGVSLSSEPAHGRTRKWMITFVKSFHWKCLWMIPLAVQLRHVYREGYRLIGGEKENVGETSAHTHRNRHISQQ